MGIKTSIKIFLVATVVALSLRLFVIEGYRVVSDSMTPVLAWGDFVLVSKFSYSLKVPFSDYEIIKIRKPSHGEVVAFSLPDIRGAVYVKRVVALEGERVEIKDGQLTIQRTPAEHRTLSDGALDGSFVEERIGNSHWFTVRITPEAKYHYGPVDVPPGHFFVLGDNRSDSRDSRVWGPVPFSSLKGRANFIWLSLTRTTGLQWDRMGKFIH